MTHWNARLLSQVSKPQFPSLLIGSKFLKFILSFISFLQALGFLKVIYLFLVALSLHCCTGFFLVVSERGLL